MSERNVCCGDGVKTLILACSGGSNVGQIANNAMIELDRKGMGNAFCLAGIGGALSGFIESAKAARTILIDGCPVGCGRKAFEKYGIEPTTYLVVTELGVEKTHDFGKQDEGTKAVSKAILSLI
jgi:uncharacterized metal-binding protein